MGEGARKGTKVWTFNKKSVFLKKINSPQNLNEDAKKTGALQSLWIEGTAKNSMGNIEQRIDPEGFITFF